ncbi:ferredoxin--NADP reductase [Gordonia insulae]|uniref:3-ketosteroid-9-alpha-monooxygenase, ferredoxin reductase component n=1 Tax=Gordonia insulae TaxID=2420509 RepID=A0A3G8JL49_9ACTN|nr:ferredoxin--NADP reductase [Gordonia insulae]AZG45807.1 3-ketosteroid-9-alpha-monooxygenase, ferredoxin reductase component [Gordonia insulae]
MPRPPLFQQATVTRVVKETDDARTYVLAPEVGPVTYKAGQFCTFRVAVDGEELYRSYSMSSSPEVDTELATTVKRVAGGRVSNWLLDNLGEGDVIDISRPAGLFCLTEHTTPLLGFSGGSGITPIYSIAKTALATTERSVRLLCADRDREAVIFDAGIAELTDRYPGRLTVVRSLDEQDGFVTESAVRDFIGDDLDADFYVCGPEPFMDLVESVLPPSGSIHIERFGAAAELPVGDSDESANVAPSQADTTAVRGTITIKLGRKEVTVDRQPGETLLESGRRAGLTPPFSCEAGNCATCIAHLDEGTATMRVNDALEDDEIEDGYVLTCQAIPDGETTVVQYE